MGESESSTPQHTHLSESRNGDPDIENKDMDSKGAGEGDDELVDWDRHIYTAVHIIDN